MIGNKAGGGEIVTALTVFAIPCVAADDVERIQSLGIQVPIGILQFAKPVE